MFKNLEAEMVRASYNREKLAKAIGVSTRTIGCKLRGETSFTWEECLAIKEALNVDMNVEKLFSKF